MTKGTMPANQQPSSSSSGSQSSSTSKSPLVRSKSLRLPSSKPKNETFTSTLTRHGSIRQPRAQSVVSISHTKQQPLSVLRKPPVKPKPVFNSKSTENLASARNLHGVNAESKQQFVTTRSPSKQHYEGGHLFSKGVTFFHDNPSPSDSPSSLHSDRSSGQNSKDTSWNQPDLVVHLKRLTEEHEKLQVEYARVRIQLLDLTPSHPATTLKREFQHLSHSDSHLASIPENSPGSTDDKSEDGFQNQEALVQAYRAEILRLQDDNRKLQRKYWEQILNSELIEDELNGGASQQIVDLIDKLDDKQRELVQSCSRVQELENDLTTVNFELQQCQDALQDYQRMLEESNVYKEKVEKQLKEANILVKEHKENIEFLQYERSSLTESLEETENSLVLHKAEKKQSDMRLNDLMTRARKLYAKIQDKNLQIQLFQAELDRTEGRARDMLLSQGAELTMTAMHLSEVSINLHNLLNRASDFAANHLELQKEMLEEITADLDSEGDKNSDLSPLDFESELLFKLPSSEESCNKTLPYLTTLPDLHKSMPDLPSSDSPANESQPLPLEVDSKPSASIVQSILQDVEKSTHKVNPMKKSSLNELHPGESAPNLKLSSAENISGVSASENNISKITFKTSGAFKPVGTAIPFRPVNQAIRDPSPPAPLPSTETWSAADDDKKKASLEGQRIQLNILLGKLKKVIELTHGKHLSKVKAFKEEISQFQEELTLYKEKEKGVHSDLQLKSQEILKLTTKLADSTAELKKLKAAHIEEKEELLKQCSELRVQNKCLEAVNEEQSRQIREEVQRTVDSAILKQNTAYFSDAVAICDKLSLKQEVVRLKETISQKENLLQTLAQKFAKTKKILEENLQKADNEVECLDGVIQNVYESLRKNPELVESSDVLKSIFSVVSGNCAPETYKEVLDNKDHPDK